MAGTKEGGLKAAATMEAKYGADYYSRIGRKGGSTPNTKPSGFALATAEERKRIGREGGRISRRGKNVPHKYQIRNAEGELVGVLVYTGNCRARGGGYPRRFVAAACQCIVGIEPAEFGERYRVERVG